MCLFAIHKANLAFLFNCFMGYHEGVMLASLGESEVCSLVAHGKEKSRLLRLACRPNAVSAIL
ncbi:hypothetical protein I7I50_04012 [Histoplasma capsulatum G186AR]|uniref:Uncharacterized protein n=1 Tax=Ajellomyces capsulatus TaxID=5037 RepID=A0A8H8CXP6_AJECA|nr:hypothetical protein I7I52_04920 [Histoplasma capsulatum]QSS75018.1 hypothetical protein I7I50_04012 [Histoplasma capsulatum G186AR]